MRVNICCSNSDLDVLGHDGYPVGVDCTEVGVLKNVDILTLDHTSHEILNRNEKSGTTCINVTDETVTS